MISLYLAVLETDEDKYEFEEMYIKCRQQMYNLAYCILHNVQDAEDAVHQSFLTIANNYEKIKQKKCQDSPRYFVIICRNVSINMYNKNKRTAEHLTEINNNQVAVDVDFLANIAYEQLMNVISTLPDSYKDVLYMHYIYQFSVKEISKMLDITVDNVWKRIERAKKLLKTRLEESEQYV